MKVWILDMGWRGGYVVLAATAEEAFEKLVADKQNIYTGRGAEKYDAGSFQELTPEEGHYRFYGDE